MLLSQLCVMCLCWEVSGSSCKRLDLWILRMSTCLETELLGSCRKDMFSGSRTPEFVAAGSSFRIFHRNPQKEAFWKEKNVRWALVNQWKKRCPQESLRLLSPDLQQVTEASAKLRQASASPGELCCLSFLLVMVKMVPTWIAWDEASGEIHCFPAQTIKPPLSLLHCRSQSRVAQYSFQSGPGGLSSRSTWGARQSTKDSCWMLHNVASCHKLLSWFVVSAQPPNKKEKIIQPTHLPVLVLFKILSEHDLHTLHTNLHTRHPHSKSTLITKKTGSQRYAVMHAEKKYRWLTGDHNLDPFGSIMFRKSPISFWNKLILNPWERCFQILSANCAPGISQYRNHQPMGF